MNAPRSHLVAVGDMMLGDSAICVGFGFHSRYPRDVSPAFGSVAPLLRRGDVVLGNLECGLTRVASSGSRLRTDQMRAEPEIARSLRAAGFTALGVANNHSMQHGIAAFRETVSVLQAAGIACVGLRGNDGWCSTPVIQQTRSGQRIGLLGYCWRPRQYEYAEPPYAEGDVEAVKEDVRRLAGMVDTVVVSLHWGEEFLGSPSVAEVEAAHRIIDAGAAVVVGHHPHVLRPLERYKSGVICYSLGNLATDMLWQPALRTGAIFECELSANAAREPSFTTTRVADSYAPIVEKTDLRPQERPPDALDESAYRSAVARSVRRQQLAAYAYALRNAYRYPPKVFAALVGVTLRNKVSGLLWRSPRRGVVGRSIDTVSRQVSGNSQSLSVLHVAAPAPFGGLESVLRELAAGQTRRGYSVHVALVLPPEDRQHPLAAALEADGVKVTAIHVEKRNYRGERSAVHALCREYSPDILHTHGYRCDVVDGPVGRSVGIPVVSTCHGFIEWDWRGRIYQWLQRRALRSFDAVVAVSQTIRERLIDAGVDAARIHLVPNAMKKPSDHLLRDEARRSLHLPNDPLIGWVGRLSAEKGPDVALDAFARVNNQNARLVFVGSGRDAAELRDRARELRVSDRVIWLGSVPNAARFFCAFDAFLLSSRTEGIPMALLEAMGARVPIVATRVGGVPEVIDTMSAWLVESEDVEGIATALSEALAGADASRVKVERAHKRLAERFAVEPWLSSYEQIYRELVRAH